MYDNEKAKKRKKEQMRLPKKTNKYKKNSKRDNNMRKATKDKKHLAANKATNKTTTQNTKWRQIPPTLPPHQDDTNLSAP